MLTGIWYKLKSLISGRYTCLVCNKRIYDFIPLPGHYRDKMERYGYKYSFDDAETLNYMRYSCPFCYSSDRDRLYALFIKRFLSGSKISTMTMLELAPSKPLSEFIRKTGRIKLRTADLLMAGVDDRVDITDMACYDKDAFDSFICSHVLEHVPDDSKALQELYRILKPGGWGILMVPIVCGVEEIDEDPFLADERERWRRFGQNDHVRLYSKEIFLSRIEATGFRINQYGLEYFGKDAFDHNAISEKSVLYIVSK